MEILMTCRSNSNWSILALNGFPDELFGAIYDLASAASRGCDEEEVSGLELRLSEFQFDAPNEEISHLSSCWRLALLLYCERAVRTQSRAHSPSSNAVTHETGVPLLSSKHSERPSSFTTGIGSSPSTDQDRRKYLAEEIIWLVRELPPESAVQKQCLIPLTLAACEIGSDMEQLHFRIMAEQYCRRWSNLCGLRAFDAALGIMETVWQLVDNGLDIENIWWGEVINLRIESQAVTGLTYGALSEEESSPVSKEYLLG